MDIMTGVKFSLLIWNPSIGLFGSFRRERGDGIKEVHWGNLYLSQLRVSLYQST